MCVSNLVMATTVNSPSCTIVKQDTTMHAKIAVSLRSSVFMWRQKHPNILMVNGTYLECLEDGGASLVSPSSSALYSALANFHSKSCRMCQSLMADYKA